MYIVSVFDFDKNGGLGKFTGFKGHLPEKSCQLWLTTITTIIVCGKDTPK